MLHIFKPPQSWTPTIDIIQDAHKQASFHSLPGRVGIMVSKHIKKSSKCIEEDGARGGGYAAITPICILALQLLSLPCRFMSHSVGRRRGCCFEYYVALIALYW